MIERHHRRHAELPYVLDVLLEVGETTLHGGDVFRAERLARNAAVHLQRAHGGDDHRR